MFKMWMYSSEPGEAGNPPALWPSASHLHHSQAVPTLVMVVHPRCACSRASIGELARLMTQVAGRLQAYVIFVRPPGVATGWDETDLWSSITLIHGASRVPDDGSEAHLFGASTSGQTMVYAPNGKLLFSGGITISRGRFGDSAGMTSIAALVGGSIDGIRPLTPVYGCPLFSLKSKKETSNPPCHR